MTQDGPSVSIDTPVYSEPYRDALALAASSGKSILTRLLGLLQADLERQQLHRSRGREQVDAALDLLRQHTEMLIERFPAVLLNTLIEPSRTVKAAAPPQKIHFDQLELMEQDQVQEGIALARIQQTILLAVDASLVELNTYVCASLGLLSVRPERNPFRPEVFVRAVQTVMLDCGVPYAVQLDWIQHSSNVLGQELARLYVALTKRLRELGVRSVGFAIARTATSARAAHEDREVGYVGGAATRRQHSEGKTSQKQLVLTLDKLNQLLAGDFEEEQGASAPLQLTPDHSAEFFDSTHPLAASGGIPLYSEQHPHPGAEIGQEVVRLLIDNVAGDPRLLAPVQQLIRSMEPSLLRLALVDPRFLNDKQHPARVLLEEITRLSQAYPSIQSAGYPSFWKALQTSVAPLLSGNVQIAQDAAPFDQAVTELTQARMPANAMEASQRQEAMEALQQAEQRNLLAEKLAKDMEQNPLLRNAPKVLVDFLCGPWAQVAAHIQLHDRSGASDPGMVNASIETLVWSAQPDLTRKNIGKLTRLLPKLLRNLRDGLALIQYPSAQTEAFFDALFALHQQAFKPPTKSQAVQTVTSAEPSPPPAWIAPAEVVATGFMDDLPTVPTTAEIQPENTETESVQAPAQANLAMAIGDWVEVLTQGAWIRTQLTWATPHGTMFLFTDAQGHCLSMSKRNYDKRMHDGSMRVVKAQMVVDEAMDAIVQLAMRNSIDNILI